MSAIVSSGALPSAGAWLISFTIIGMALRIGAIHRAPPLVVSRVYQDARDLGFEAVATGRDRRCEAPSSLL
jgi:hypothetical protein